MNSSWKRTGTAKDRSGLGEGRYVWHVSVGGARHCH